MCPANHAQPSGFVPFGHGEEAGIPSCSTWVAKKMSMAYTENGGEKVKDFHGGDENFAGLSYMAIPLSIWQTMTALIFDGVFDRHPNKFGVIELGASWLPSWLRFMDSGFEAFRKASTTSSCR